MPELLTPKEVGHHFRVTTRTVHNWIESGQIRAIQISGTVRIPQGEIQRMGKEANEENREK